MEDLQPNNFTMEKRKSYILITGASAGIGRCLAIKLSSEFNVILHGRNIERLNETKSLCSNINDQLVLSFDFVRVDEIEKVFSTFIIEKSIEITHFVHCAGFMKMIPLKMITLETINATFSTNVISAIVLTKVLAQRKINFNALKSIVFVSSNISNFGAKAFSIYAASKGALDSLMRCLAVELAPNVRVNSVLPGAIETSMTQTVFQSKETIDRMMLTYPLGFGTPEDVYEMVNFLLSNKSRWITGQQFTVDGGRTINVSG
jgi:NAD(P)-dependent dehydrogenase (short-subunit alcohol dehydrogenase family)